MRLRSSQFVFLLLLACSVQQAQPYLLQQVLEAAPRCSDTVPQLRTVANSATHRNPLLPLAPIHPGTPTRLDPASIALHTAPWSMRRAAQESAAIFSFTGFLRT